MTVHAYGMFEVLRVFQVREVSERNIFLPETG